MPIGSPTDPRMLFAGSQIEDALGHDPLARAFLRNLCRLHAGSVVLVQGAPGSGRQQFMLRCAYLLDRERASIGLMPTDAIDTNWAWYDPWLFSHRGQVLSGLAITMAQFASHGPQAMEKAREIVSRLNRMRLVGQRNETVGGTALEPGELGPVDRLRMSFRGLVNAVRESGSGRLVVFVAEADLLSPDLRIALLEGFKMVLEPRTELTLVVSLGREAAISAVRHREGDISREAARRWLDPFVDLTLTVPNLETRKIGSLLRRYVQPNLPRIQQAFGQDAVLALAAAAAHQPLGNPDFLRRLATRLTQLSEYAIEVRATRELSEAQWAWFIVADRWPDFRRELILGGRDRWQDLLQVLGGGSGRDPTLLPGGRSSSLAAVMSREPLLVDYLRVHAAGFERDADGIEWVEQLLVQAGL